MVPEIAVKALPTHCNFAALVSKSVHHMGFTSAMTNFCFDQRHLNLLLLGMVGFFIRSSTVRLATSSRSALINSSFSSDAPVQLPSRLRFAPEAGIPPAPLFRGASGSTLPRPRAVTDAPSISVRAEAPASAVLARALLSTLKAFSSQTIRRMGTPLAASFARAGGGQHPSLVRTALPCREPMIAAFTSFIRGCTSRRQITTPGLEGN